MGMYDDVMAVENGEDDLEAMQRLINSGVAWSLQGSMGRSMMQAIEEGFAMCAKTRSTDYWGNVIPSRYDLKPGTKGTVEYVMEHVGEEVARKLEAL